MSLIDAVTATGPLPPDDAPQAEKKRYSEILSSKLAVEVAAGLRSVGFPDVKPLPDGPGEKAFQGGLGPKKVDVAYSDEQHGLMLAVSIKTINAPPYGKNLKNRFADLCTECITLHMRFPYAVLSALFAFPAPADEDVTDIRTVSTFARAAKLLATVSGRSAHGNAAEKFENATVMLFQPLRHGGPKPWVRLTAAETGEQISEKKYFLTLRDIYNERNPHTAYWLAAVGGRFLVLPFSPALCARSQKGRCGVLPFPDQLAAEYLVPPGVRGAAELLKDLEVRLADLHGRSGLVAVLQQKDVAEPRLGRRDKRPFAVGRP